MHVYLETRAECQGKSGTLRGKYSLNLQLGSYSSRICINPRSGAGSVACDENREMMRGTAGMALGMYFTPSSFTPARYDDAIKRLEEAGAGAPPGRLYHVAMEADGLIQVFDVWESEASFQAFGKTLLPIMKDLGADPGQPQASPVHNMIKGERRARGPRRLCPARRAWVKTGRRRRAVPLTRRRGCAGRPPRGRA